MSDPKLREFGQRLRALLEERSLSQADLARAVFGEGKDKQGKLYVKGQDSITRYVAGKVRPKQDVLLKIASILEVEPSTFGTVFYEQTNQHIEQCVLDQIGPNRMRLRFVGDFDREMVVKFLQLLDEQARRDSQLRESPPEK